MEKKIENAVKQYETIHETDPQNPYSAAELDSELANIYEDARQRSEHIDGNKTLTAAYLAMLTAYKYGAALGYRKAQNDTKAAQL